ncbi:tetratricopeptide repeat protein [Pseudomonas citronellolis]|jgi:Flp pilus assembly protein TadD|uniref:hypothetical protein n=1 Tax=Pseudomonas citronellolis TaxID=53408 RepID=UPI002D786411|nr:hypothetical protein [Pseudomonas citronellolis]WRT83555.1 hypothetical protein VK748_03765 [Pseudomonas citronellolis]
MRTLCLLGFIGLALGGCANLPDDLRGNLAESFPALGQSCGSRLSQDQELQLDMARGMLREGRLHAALAHLQTLPAQSLDVRESKAVALRRIGSPQARAEYQALLGTCKAGEAHHGLGQIALREGRIAEAERELRVAARLQPTDRLVRNDLGVVLLRKGDREGARFEFLTALELDGDDKLPASNLLSLLLLEGKTAQATALAEKARLSDEQVRQARQRADALRSGAPAPRVAQVAAPLPAVPAADGASVAQVRVQAQPLPQPLVEQQIR